MKAYDYSFEQLAEALDAVGIKKGDVLYCHSNIGFFGRPCGQFSREELCQSFLEVVLSAIGNLGVLIVPTYTYSYSNGLVFNPVSSPSKMGIWAEYIRKSSVSMRSHDPFFSVAAIGNAPERFCKELPSNSFEKNSTFDRFYRDNGKILCFNHPGCTMLHYVERELRVPYRFDKYFRGQFQREDGQQESREWGIWVRYLSDEMLAHDPFPFVEYVKNERIARWTHLGRGEILSISAHDVFEVVKERISQFPWFLTKAHMQGVEPNIDTSYR